MSPLCIGLKINTVVHKRVRVCRMVGDPTTTWQLWVVDFGVVPVRFPVLEKAFELAKRRRLCASDASISEQFIRTFQVGYRAGEK